VTATYGGDGNFNASAPSGAKVETVSRASDSIALSSSHYAQLVCAPVALLH